MAEKKFTIESSEVVHVGAVVRTEIAKMRTPEGDLIDRQVVRHPGAVAVVAVHQDQVVLVEQYRAAIDDNLIEIPAGKLDIAGEATEAAAARELVEEVGLKPNSPMIELGMFVVAAGFSDEVITIYFTNDCTNVGRQVDGIEEAHSEILWIPLAEVDEWLDSRLTDAKSLIGLFWAKSRGLLATGA